MTLQHKALTVEAAPHGGFCVKEVGNSECPWIVLAAFTTLAEAVSYVDKALSAPTAIVIGANGAEPFDAGNLEHREIEARSNPTVGSNAWIRRVLRDIDEDERRHAGCPSLSQQKQAI